MKEEPDTAHLENYQTKLELFRHKKQLRREDSNYRTSSLLMNKS